MLSSTALPVEKADPEATREMPHMMLALGIEPALLKTDHPAIYAAMEHVCAGCGSKETCKKDLAVEKAASAFAEYCGNAATLSLLRERAELARD